MRGSVKLSLHCSVENRRQNILIEVNCQLTEGDSATYCTMIGPMAR